jgi:hypothetical protein
MAIDFTISQNAQDGTTLSFVDKSATFTGVLQTRFIWGSYTGDLAAVETNLIEGDSLEQYRQYQKTSLFGSVYNGKTIPVGGMYIPFVTGLTVLAGDTFKETGRTSKFVSWPTYLPTSSYNIFTRTPQDLLYPSDVTVFPAGIYYLQYERYTYTIPSTLTNVTQGSTYMVLGGCTYNGNTYINGEVFVAGDNGSVSFSRGNTLYILQDAKFSYFLCDFEIVRDLDALEWRAIASCGCDCEWQKQIWILRQKLLLIQRAMIMNRTSATLCNTLLENIQTEIARLESCIPQV